MKYKSRVDMSQNENKKVCLGKILAPYGVTGQVKIKSFAQSPTALAEYRVLSDEHGTNRFSIQHYKQKQDVLIATLEGISSREQAHNISGTFLYIERDQLPVLSDENEFYYTDLIGLHAESKNKEALGIVKDVLDFGGGTILEIQNNRQESLLILFTRQNIPQIDVKKQQIIVDLPTER